MSLMSHITGINLKYLSIIFIPHWPQLFNQHFNFPHSIVFPYIYYLKFASRMCPISLWWLGKTQILLIEAKKKKRKVGSSFSKTLPPPTLVSSPPIPISLGNQNSFQLLSFTIASLKSTRPALSVKIAILNNGKKQNKKKLPDVTIYSLFLFHETNVQIFWVFFFFFRNS